MSTIALRDESGESRNDYKLVFSGDEKPSFADVHGATDSPNADIYQNNQNDWVIENHIWDGIDGWTYTGEKIQMVFDDTSRVDGQVNDKGWQPITDFDSAEEFGGRGGSSGSPSMDERLDAVDPSGSRESVAVYSASDYETFINGINIPENSELGAAIADGTYDPPAIQRTLLFTRPEYSTRIRGNVENPYAVDLSRANHNFTILIKDEHFWVRGMLWGRTQFSGCGDPYVRNMAFTDRHGKGQSALGGKRACGRFINCDIGHKDDPDEYAAYYYGGGEVLFDKGNTFRATGDAYIGANNHVTINISDNNDFANGNKELVKGSDIYPSDLSNSMNVIKNGELY
jgi:hypothetical protein